jgi:hypothetical protein
LAEPPVQLSLATASPPVSNHSTLTSCDPALSDLVPVNVVAGWSRHWSMRMAPSIQTRMPSSLTAVKVYCPAVGKSKVPVHRAEKLSGPTPAGDPVPQLWSKGAGSQTVDAGAPERVLMEKYSARC